MQKDFDDLPLPADVECIFNEHAGDGLTALAWLEEHGIDAANVRTVALLDYAFVWTADTGRYDFRVYPLEHIGPKQSALAIPVYEGGKFVDLLLIDDDMSYRMTCGTPWLGRESVTGNVRLHAHPMDWLEAGCVGCCHVAPINRQGLKILREAKSIVCNDVTTAIDAFSWIEDYGMAEGIVFECDDTPDAIERYFDADMDGRCAAIEREAYWCRRV